MSFEQRIPTILELGFRKEAIDQLKSYLDLLWSSNEELNLISRKMTFDELLDNHVIDCLLPLKFFPQDAKAVADFGSGGGLPGVIYAIQFPDIQFHLYEKSNLKQNFLNSCKKIAPNLNVHGEIPKDLVNVDVVTARGFKPVDVILDVSRSYYAKKGKYFLLKARKEKIDEELLLARKKFKDLKVAIEPLKSPVLEVERHLVLI
ncbi:class I SAM-dependent methyltransferase [Bdellovibrio sp. SKB1291214]|uniref:16S rRNA (guanine(527)-N(7))-methyltransferase RsmG n=1 Tax=Bdellovibrio sp. SKB1291214 TaxID=1732569 RepID=UPI000B519750|nr:RsmG family class I SAM-dependent methyltransferase [Bdellovibrio sp. SKB1291214]UYL10304.1 class I SAM-dependent methyltransferase [Bdellovibrio sp. SKB1291214]